MSVLTIGTKSHRVTILLLAAAAFGFALADADRDGQTRTQGDCDDGDAGAHTGAVEVCNAHDDDCDGSTDESCETSCPFLGLKSKRVPLDPNSSYVGTLTFQHGRIRSGVLAVATPGGAAAGGLWLRTVGLGAEPTGAVLIDPLAASEPRAGLAWSGERPGLSWVRSGSPARCMHAQFTEELQLAAPASTLSNATATCVESDISWSGSRYGVAWIESEATQDRLYFAAQAPVPGAPSPTVTMSPPGKRIRSAALAWRSNSFGIAWLESNGSGFRLTHNELNEIGTPLRAPRQTAALGLAAADLTMIWIGDRYVASWTDQAGSGKEIWLAELTTSGSLLSAPLVVSAADGLDSTNSYLDWTGTRIVVSWMETGSSPQHGQIALYQPGLTLRGGPYAVTDGGGSAMSVVAVTVGTHLLATYRTSSGALSTARISCLDGDGDGAAFAVDECQDAVSGISPTAAEICNGFDENCSADPDEGCGFASCPSPQVLPEVPLSPIGPPDGNSSQGLVLAWAGDRYGVAWSDDRTGNGSFQAYFRLMDPAGQPLSPEVLLTPPPEDGFVADLVWNGYRFALLWTSSRGYPPNQGDEVYVQLLSKDGVPIADETLVSEMNTSFVDGILNWAWPSIAWNGSGYMVAWSDRRDDPRYPEIYTRLLDADGRLLGLPTRATDFPTGQRRPSIAWTGSNYGMAWVLNNSVAYFRLLGADGRAASPARSLEEWQVFLQPSVVWTGEKFVSSFIATKPSCDKCVEARLVAADGTPLLEPIRLSGPGVEDMTKLLWTGGESAIAWTEWTSSTQQYQRLGRLDPLTGNVLGSQDVTVQTVGSLLGTNGLAWTGTYYRRIWQYVPDATYNYRHFSSTVRCCRDLDLDGVSLCDDCDDANPQRRPGLVESCDHLDNDCDGSVDESTGPPAATSGLVVAGAGSVSWPAQLGADTYDVVKGSATALKNSSGDYSSSVTSCLANDLLLLSIDDPAPPASGDSSFYLLRAIGCGAQAGTYDESVGGQSAPRDAEVNLAAAACP